MPVKPAAVKKTLDLPNSLRASCKLIWHFKALIMQLAHRFLSVSQHGFIVQSALGVLKLSNMRLRRASVCVSGQDLMQTCI